MGDCGRSAARRGGTNSKDRPEEPVVGRHGAHRVPLLAVILLAFYVTSRFVQPAPRPCCAVDRRARRRPSATRSATRHSSRATACWAPSVGRGGEHEAARRRWRRRCLRQGGIAPPVTRYRVAHRVARRALPRTGVGLRARCTEVVGPAPQSCRAAHRDRRRRKRHATARADAARHGRDRCGATLLPLSAEQASPRSPRARSTRRY